MRVNRIFKVNDYRDCQVNEWKLNYSMIEVPISLGQIPASLSITVFREMLTMQQGTIKS